MTRLFEELDYQITPLGALSLRRRRQLKLGVDVVEVILGDEHLMSDLFVTSEEALAYLPLAQMNGGSLDILVGGLGLGYTARAVLTHKNIRSLTIIEYLEPVIKWHREGLLPLGSQIYNDPRCQIIHADFFASLEQPPGSAQNRPNRQFDGIFLDIDHTPDFYLTPQHAHFYTPEGLKKLADNLKEGGLFSLWSNAAADQSFVARLKGVFGSARAQNVCFLNPIMENEVNQTIYIAQK